MRKEAFALVCVVLLLGLVWITPSFGIPMVITEGTFTPVGGGPQPISGTMNFRANTDWVETFGGVNTQLLIDGFDPIDSRDWPEGEFCEIQGVFEDHLEFYNLGGAADIYGRVVRMDGIAYYDAESYGGRDDPPVYWPHATGVTYNSVSTEIQLGTAPYSDEYGNWQSGEPIGSIDLIAESIEYDAIVGPIPPMGGDPYYTDMTLGRTLDFDYWWEMGFEPPSYQQGYMFDVLALQGGEGWQYIGQIDTYGSSRDWETASIAVPENLWGTQTEVRFVLNDYSPVTSPAVYLRNLSTSPVPEPSTLLLMGSSLIGFVVFRKRSRKS